VPTAPGRPNAFPSLQLAGPDGGVLDPGASWLDGEALVLVGHRDCKTTRQTLPVLDRIHCRRTCGTVLAVMQDDAHTAQALVESLGLALPVVLEPDPYPLARALGLEAVPSLYLVERGGAIADVSIGFSRADLERFAARLGVDGPLFEADEKVPAFRPG
jgi:hypothetical protein